MTTAVLSGVLFVGGFGFVSAQTDDVLVIEADGNVVTADFSRATPCTSYTVTWGDDTEEVFESEAEMCIQVIDDVSLEHTYEEAGTYTIELTMSGTTWSDEVTISEEDLETEPVAPFTLADVDTITYVWVDPNEMMADEEYYVYTITLKSGAVVTLEAGGFTTREYRNEQFTNAGYTGDVDALLAIATDGSEAEVAEDNETPADPEAQLVSLYLKLKGLLEEMVSRLQSLL